MSALYHITLVVWCCFECILVTSIIFGWAQLLEVLEREKYFWSYCDVNVTRVHNATGLSNDQTCSKQDSILNLVYSLASFTTPVSLFIGGKFVDTYGFKKTRLLSCIIYFLAGVLVYISTLGCHELLFPGLILTCIGGSFFMCCLVKVCGLIPHRRCTVIGLVNSSIDVSAIMLLIFKLSYRAGLPLSTIVIVYYSFSTVHGLIFTFTLFPKSSKTPSRREVVTLGDNENKRSIQDKVNENQIDNSVRKVVLSFPASESSTIIGNKIGNYAQEENVQNISSCDPGSFQSEISCYQNDVVIQDEVENKDELCSSQTDSDDNSKILEIGLPLNEIPYLQTNGHHSTTENGEHGITCSQNKSFVILSTQDHSIIIGNKTLRDELLRAKERSTVTMAEQCVEQNKNMPCPTSSASNVKRSSTDFPSLHEESLWSIIKTPMFLLHTCFTAVNIVRIYIFVGMVNLNLRRLTNDQDKVDLYLTVFAAMIILEVLFCFVPGTLLDWNAKGKHTNYSMILAFVLTNCISILLTIGTLIPLLKVQMLCFVLYSLSRLFVFSCHGSFVISRYPLKHTGALFGFSLLIAAMFSLVQFPLFILVEGPCNGNTTLVNAGILVIQILMFTHPVYLQRLSTKREVLETKSQEA